jgi:hypothetical protein
MQFKTACTHYRGGEECSCLGYILKAELAGHADAFNIE